MMVHEQVKNYYKVLQVDVSANQDLVEAAYKRLARKYHPDVNRTADATAKIQEIIPGASCLCQPSHFLLTKQQ
jgi:molecular chaperone DnaJ